MFNRKIELRVVKDTKPKNETPAETLDRINSKEAIKELIKFTVIGTVVVLAASVVLNTLGAVVIEAVSANKE